MANSAVQQSSSELSSDHAAADTSPPVSDATAGARTSSRRFAGPARSRRWLVINVVIPLLIIAGGAAAILAFGQQTPPVKPPEDMSLAARVKRLPEADTLPVRSLDAVGGKLRLEVDGVVVPYREVQLATEVAGRVVYKDPACEVGSYVEEGQLLLRIDDTDYRKEVKRLKSRKEQEYQALRELDQEMANTERLLELAEQQVQLQEREIARLESLPSGVASLAEIDAAQRARLQAVNSRVTLENQLAAMRQRRGRLQAAEALAETQLEVAQINLERTEIRAPVSGVVFREDAELNSFVQRGQVVVTIEDTSKAEVVINLRPDQLYWVLDQAGAEDTASPAEVIADPTRGYSIPPTPAAVRYEVAGREEELYQWAGRLERYDGIGVDTTSRTVPVRVVVDQPRKREIVNSDGEKVDRRAGRLALVRGMFVSVILEIEPRRPLVVIPGVALKPGGNGSRVWKFEPDRSVIEIEEPAASDGVAESESSAAQRAVTAGPSSTRADADESSAPRDTDTDTGAPPTDSAAPAPFDPEVWTVGRIDVIDRVRPIESARLLAGQAFDGELAIDSTGKARYWICEVAGGQLEPGDRLVVSPLASFESAGVNAVRVEGTPAGSTAEAARQTSAGPGTIEPPRQPQDRVES